MADTFVNQGNSQVSNLAMFKEKVEQQIVVTAENRVIHPEISRNVPVAKGNNVEYNSTSSSLSFGNVGVVGEPDSEALTLTRNIVSFAEKASAPLLPIRYVEDADWDTIQLFLDKLGIAGALQMNSSVLTTYHASAGVTQAGTAWSTTSTDIIANISDAMKQVEANNYLAANVTQAPRGRIAMHTAQYAACRVNDDFRKATVQGENVQTGGKIDSILALGILTTNAQTSGRALLVDLDFPASFYNRKPLGVDVEKMGRVFKLGAFMRYGVAVKVANAVAEITSIT